MRVRVFGKIWNFKRMAGMKDRGRCEAPTKKNKTIYVDKKLGGEKELEVIIHELLHAADWYKDEEWVEEVACDMSRFLYRLGYRKESQKPNARTEVKRESN